MTFMTQVDNAQIMAAFTQPVVAFKGGTGERGFDAIFDNWHQSYGDDLQLSSVYPVLFCLESDANGMVQGDPVNVDGNDYHIRDVQPDGLGIIRMELKKA